MSPRSLVLALPFLVACPSPSDCPDDTGDTDNPYALCDVDEDGYPGELCDGNDCDDNDPDRNPMATEVLGDEIDQDCDGLVDLGTDAVVPLAYPDLEGWSFRDDLLAVGGAVSSDEGRVSGFTMSFPPTGPVHTYAIENVLYGDVGEPLAGPVREWSGEEPIDVFVTPDEGTWTLTAWDRHGVVFFDSHPDLPPTQIDAWLDGDVLHNVACGSGSLHYVRASLTTGEVEVDTSMASEADRCLILLSGEQLMVLVGSSGVGDLTRYDLTDVGFEDSLVLATDVSLAQFDSTVKGDTAYLAFQHEDGFYIFDAEAHGTIVPYTTDPTSLVIDADGIGNIVVGWIEGNVVHVAIGPFDETLRETTYEAATAPTALTVGLDESSVVMGVTDGENWVIGRALRE